MEFTERVDVPCKGENSLRSHRTVVDKADNHYNRPASQRGFPPPLVSILC